MNIELNNTTLLVVVLLLAVVYFCLSGKTEKKEGWTMLAGAPQSWRKLPREENICDTGFEDDECKFSAVNCLRNPNSAFYGNE